MAAAHGHPYDLHKLERYRGIIPDWQGFAEASLAPLPTTLWVNTLRGSREDIQAFLAEDGAETDPLGWYSRGLRLRPPARPGKTFAFLTGACHVQEEVSMMPIVLLDPQPGESVLDLCAAPGNKKHPGGGAHGRPRRPGRLRRQRRPARPGDPQRRADGRSP